MNKNSKLDKLTQKMLKKLVIYDSNTGIFIWKERPIEMFQSGKKQLNACKTWNTIYSRKIAGTKVKKKTNTYIAITITLNGKSKSYRAHRLAFLYMTGKFPSLGIDHLDGNGMNNKWNNLKQKSNSDNLKNAKMSSNNTSGFNGVCWHKESKKWKAQVWHNNKTIYGGIFVNKEDAIAKREEMNSEYNYSKRHGLESI